MNTKKKTLFGALAIALTGALLAGCSATGSSGSDGEAGYADTIHYPINATTASLDPQVSPGGVPAYIGSHIFETLVAQDETLTPQPALAESWTLSDDQLSWTFSLRQGVRFHNGEEMHADDVAASLNRWKSLTGRAKQLLGASEFEVVDEYTVRVTLATPRGDLLAQLANPLQFAAIMPAEVIASATPAGVTEYIGTGPYRVDAFNVDQNVQLSRFDGYTGVDTEPSGFSGRKEAPTEHISFDFVLDNSTRFSSFLSGDFDIVDVSTDNLATAKAEAGVQVERRLGNSYAVVFNMKQGIGKNEAFRQAVALAINADDYLTASVSDPELYRLNPSYAWTENTAWWTDAGSKGRYNVGDAAQAKTKLKEARYAGETVHLLTTQDYAGTHYRASVILQSQLEAIGVKTQLDVLDYPSLLQKRNSFQGWEIYTGAFIVPSTPSQLIYLAASYGGNDDPELARLVTATAEAVSAEQQQAASVALEEYLWEHVPTINVGDTYTYQAVRDTVQGFVNFNGYPILWNAKIAK